VEEKNVYRLWNIHLPYANQPVAATQVGIKTYFCPSRRTPTAAFSNDSPPGGLSDFAACSGTGNGDGVGANGAIIAARSTVSSATDPPQVVNWSGVVTLNSILDGTSNTFLAGEKHVRWSTQFGRGEDRTVLGATNGNNYRRFAGIGPETGDTYVLQLYDPAPQWNEQTASNRSFGSRHPGVCQFVMCDGSVRPIQNSTDVTTLGRLAARNDGQVITGDQ
jgi:prepilin-type processing-associated H-X9-DG protein